MWLRLPSGYQGEFCQTKTDFVTCKINGSDYQSVKIILDTVPGPSGTLRRITTSANSSDSKIIQLSFYLSLPAGIYQTSGSSSDPFYGMYIKDQAYEYYSTSGSLVLTNAGDRYEGAFSFTGTYVPLDTVVVATGSFSIKK